ncbi:MAG: cupin domain-containing protein [Cognatishimia sp.]|uniref:cupin domain-containing protein n=1 Tax=Cognatishimia sp. TaxID=2211648 RepID=UPI003B8B43F0
MQVNKDTPDQWLSLGESGERRIVCQNDELMMVQFRFVKGQKGIPHSHPHVQSTIVASGKFEFTVGDITKVLEPGDGFVVPSNVVHSCVCLEDGLLTDAFTPTRKDFVEAHGL